MTATLDGAANQRKDEPEPTAEEKVAVELVRRAQEQTQIIRICILQPSLGSLSGSTKNRRSEIVRAKDNVSDYYGA